VVGCPTAVREDPGSNLTAASRVYHDGHCDICHDDSTINIVVVNIIIIIISAVNSEHL